MRYISRIRALRWPPRWWSTALLAGWLLAAGTVAGWAQQVTAAITGKITDATGASVVDAKVTATDVDRGTVWPTATNADGIYNLPRLPIGSYNVKVEKEGFQTAQSSQVVLQLNDNARLDFQLKVGSITQSVEVTSAAPLLQTQATQLGQVIDSRTNVDLPLATRNYVQLTLLAPGSIHPDPSTFESGQTTASSGRPNVNGNREQANNFILDGLDNNQASDNLVGYAPAVDAIQEFNEITLNAPAEFGNFMGGIISATIKSGTNQFHGSAYEFFRNDVLNANTWSNNFEGAARSAVRWNNFGATFGGPIKKDKLFFFADYQGSRLDTPTSISTTSLYTTAERTGDFSQLLNQASPVQLYNPFSLTATGARTPFANNQVPLSLMSPAALKIITSQYYPQPTNGNLINNYQYATNTHTNGDQGDFKIDWNIDDKDRFFGRYSQSMFDNPTDNAYALKYNSFATYPTHTGDLDWTRTIGPSLVNEARAGVNYVFINNGSASNNLSNFAQTVGIPGVPSSFLPSMSLSGGNVAGFGTADVYQLFADTTMQFEDTAIWTHGSHTMRFGFQIYRYRMDTFYSGNNGEAGTFLFNGQYTSNAPGTKAGSGNGGIAEADFLLGLPDEIQGGVNGGTWGQRADSMAAFYQDDWRVTPNLTLNLGLRWELHTPWVEVENREANFNLATGQEYIAGQTCPWSNCNALYNQYNGITNFQPRLGFAYTPGGGKTVIRGGYTLSNYLEGTGTNLRLPINPPFAVEHDNQYTGQPFYQLPGSTLDQGFLPFTANAGNQFQDVTLRVWDPNIRPAVANQWNLTIQRQITSTSTLALSYVGERTTHLMVPMPYFQKVLNANGTVSPTEYLAGNPQLLSEIGQISGTASIGNQSYNALQALLQKRLSAGLQYSVAYTWSKCMTNNLGYYGQGGQSGQSNWYYQNIYDAAAEWGPCDYDATHNFVANAIYDLPLGRGRTFGKNMNRVADAVIGGWQASAILSLHTGFPLTVGAADASGTGSRGPRADCIAAPDVFGQQNSPLGGYQWYNPASYTQPAAGTFGSCGVGTVRGPGLHTVDFDLTKNFKITERQNLDLRADFINLTNTPILNSPNNGIGTTLGLLQSSQGARNVQFSLKYHF
ncbi:MAG TPA: carboxypeptidase regulatory-like domain-containing protein [Bryobacteraceae bacterium]|nr:carboxypeptidase regulatory-like domain-containing protein [Bryobacteraceae bacterium]